MHQKYRSGEPRTNQSASGSGTGSENSGNQTGSDTENSGKPDSGENTASPESTANLVDETKTKLTEMNSLGWWLPIVYEEGYTTENTVVTVDGVDVTSALTKVTDDGSIGKLALQRTPGTIRISSTEDADKYETIALSEATTETENTDANDKTEDGACKLRTGRHHEGR